MNYDDALVSRTFHKAGYTNDGVAIEEVWDLGHPSCPHVVMGHTSGHHMIVTIVTGENFRKRYGVELEALLDAGFVIAPAE